MHYFLHLLQSDHLGEGEAGIHQQGHTTNKLSGLSRLLEDRFQFIAIVS